MRSGSTAGGVPQAGQGGRRAHCPRGGARGPGDVHTLTDGRRLAQALRLDKLGRLKVLPVSLALPWGLNIGDLLGHFPLPAKIRMEVLSPLDVVETFGEEADSKRAYDYVTTRMQEVLTALAAERVMAPA